MKRALLSTLSCIVLGVSATWLFPIKGVGENYRIAFRDELIVFDQYLKREGPKVKRERLRALAETLSIRPSETAYIVSYGVVSKLDCGSSKELQSVHDYIIGNLRVKRERIMLVDGGFSNEAKTVIYLLPANAKFPEADFRYNINDYIGRTPKPNS